MPAVARQFKILYDTFEVCGTTERVLDGDLRVTRSSRKAVVEFAFLISATTDAAFATEIAAVEEAFIKTGKRLQILTGPAFATTMYDFDPASGTGQHSEPEIRKAGSPADSNRTRRYEVAITFERPEGSVGGGSGRVESKDLIEVTHTPARRHTVTFTGSYVRTGISALANYVAGFDTYCLANLASLFPGQTFEEDQDEFIPDSTADNLDFRRVYEQVWFNETTGALNLDAIVRQELVIRRKRRAPGDTALPGGPNGRTSPGGKGQRAFRLVEFTVDYSAWIKKQESTTPPDIIAAWQDTVRPHLLQTVKNTVGMVADAALILLEEEPAFDWPQNRIHARLIVATFQTGGGDLIESEVSERTHVETGTVFIPVWSGKKFERHVFDGPARMLRTRELVARFKGSGKAVEDEAKDRIGNIFAEDQDQPEPAGAGGGRWFLVAKDVDAKPKRLGIEPDAQDFVDVTLTSVWEWADASKPASGVSGGAGSGEAVNPIIKIGS